MISNKETALQILGGKISLKDRKLVRVPIASRDMPEALWKTFGAVAKLNSKTLEECLPEAIKLWLKENWPEARHS